MHILHIYISSKFSHFFLVKSSDQFLSFSDGPPLVDRGSETQSPRGPESQFLRHWGPGREHYPTDPGE